MTPREAEKMLDRMAAIAAQAVQQSNPSGQFQGGGLELVRDFLEKQEQTGKGAVTVSRDNPRTEAFGEAVQLSLVAPKTDKSVEVMGLCAKALAPYAGVSAGIDDIRPGTIRLVIRIAY